MREDLYTNVWGKTKVDRSHGAIHIVSRRQISPGYYQEIADRYRAFFWFFFYLYFWSLLL